MEPSFRQERGARKPEERIVSGQSIFWRGIGGDVNSKLFIIQITSQVLIRNFQMDCYPFLGGG